MADDVVGWLWPSLSLVHTYVCFAQARLCTHAAASRYLNSYRANRRLSQGQVPATVRGPLALRWEPRVSTISRSRIGPAIADFRVLIFDCLFPSEIPIKNHQSKIENVETHPLPRDGT